MTPKRLLLAALILFSLHEAWQWHVHRPIARPSGVLVASVPLQEAITQPVAIAVGDFKLTPLATFVLDARVLMVSRYRWDTESALAPYDLGVGWQRMSDSSVLDQMEFAQSARFLTWRWSDTAPIPQEEITRSATNIHVIPANAYVEQQIAAMRPGQLVSLRGKLVETERADGWRWRSSLTRDDAGNGACELMYLESVSIKD